MQCSITQMFAVPCVAGNSSTQPSEKELQHFPCPFDKYPFGQPPLIPLFPCVVIVLVLVSVFVSVILCSSEGIPLIFSPPSLIQIPVKGLQHIPCPLGKYPSGHSAVLNEAVGFCGTDLSFFLIFEIVS